MYVCIAGYKTRNDEQRVLWFEHIWAKTNDEKKLRSSEHGGKSETKIVKKNKREEESVFQKKGMGS